MIIKYDDVKAQRIVFRPIGIPPVDRLLGGGLPIGSSLVISGGKGAGKSTLVAQIVSNLHDVKTLYSSAEEPPDQVKARFERLGNQNQKIFFYRTIKGCYIEDIEKIISEGDYKDCIIDNIPKITDVERMENILRGLGASVKRISKHKVEINCSKIDTTNPDFQEVKEMRSSILLMGPLLARFKKIKIPHPGGCIIGARPIGTHFEALEALGAKITQDQDYLHLEAKKLIGTKIVLREFSVTATENAMMAACFALNSMGAKIKGAGTHTIIVEGVKKLHGTKYTLAPDQIEAGTFVIAAIVTRGDVIIDKINPDHLDIILEKLREARANFEVGKDYIHIKPSSLLKATNIDTRPYPGFPTDLQAPWGVLATQAEGTTLIHETMFEGRLRYIDELKKMGANAIIADPHRALITGPTPLYGTQITSFDLRAGATLIIASLIAEGQSEIKDIEQVDR